MHATLPPATSGAASTSTIPPMWNIGSTCRQRSSAPRPTDAIRFPTDASRLRCVSGTFLGRDVVPDVCSTSATSSARRNPPSRAEAADPGAASRNTPVSAPSTGNTSTTGTPCACATARAAGACPAWRSASRGLRLEKWNANSASRYSGLSGAAAAHADTARHAVASSAPCGITMAMQSPRPAPARFSVPTVDATSPASPARVSGRRPADASATASGWRSASCARRPGRVSGKGCIVGWAAPARLAGRQSPIGRPRPAGPRDRRSPSL